MTATLSGDGADTGRDRHADASIEAFCSVRRLTEALAAPLSPEDQTVQSMPDVSPTKWHRAHTSWFFETFVLVPYLEGYEPFDPAYAYLFNSYYEALGDRHPRPERGLVSRPGAEEIGRYRRHVDEHVVRLLESTGAARHASEVAFLLELGAHHEQQHQELLVMDIKHVLSQSPLDPAYLEPAPAPPAPSPFEAGFAAHPGGEVRIGHGGPGFAFDNEGPPHVVHLLPFELAEAPVTCGEWLAFVEDGGYRRPELWLSEGWATVCQQGWQAPLYWRDEGREWSVFTLSGRRPVRGDEPVCHVSYYEADAFARWAGARLPTEFEWEAVASGRPVAGGFLDPTRLHPSPARGPAIFGEVWNWTSSGYAPYPRFRPAEGAIGEYNGKFMVNQQVLRGGCCATPEGHLRASYRNFFPARARWPFTGVRLARDLEAA